MSLNIEKVAKLVGFVDRLIQIKEAENQLDEKTIDEMIKHIRYLPHLGRVFLRIMMKQTGMKMQRVILLLYSGRAIKTT